MKRAGRILTVAVGAVALAAAGCGSARQAAAPGTSGSTQATVSRPARTPAATVGPGAAVAARYSPCARSFPGMPAGRALASLYAGSLVCDFAVPPGARRLAHVPDAGDGFLKQSLPQPGLPYETDRVQFWQVPGSPQGVLAWEKRHLPRALAASGSGLGSLRGITVEWQDSYDLPAVPGQPSPGGQIDSRTMTVFAVDAGNGRADMEVLVSVGWIPPRSAAGPALAVADPDLEGCQRVSFTIGGKPQPSLGPVGGGLSFAASVARVAGLSWNLSKMVM